MIGEGGPTQFNVAGGRDPFVELLQQVQEAAQGVYDVLGEMGRSTSGNVVYLARELESAHLVALKLTRTGGGKEYSLEVVRTLDATVPGLESTCPECKAVLPDWDRFCFRCGADLSAQADVSAQAETAQLLEAVKEATAQDYEILGQMSRAEGRGAVYFARDRARGKLVALRLRREDAEGGAAYSIGETQILRPMAAQFGATQVLGALGPRVPPPPLQAPAPAPTSAPAAPVAPEPLAGRRSFAIGAALARLPRRAWLGAGGGLLALVVLAVALSGDDPVVVPAAPAIDTTAALAADSTDLAAGADAAGVPPPSSPVLVAQDSATIRLAVTLPFGAVFTVDGSPMRSGTVRVAAGRHTLSVVMAGIPPVSSRVNVRPEQVFSWAPKLQSEVVVNPPPPPPTRTPPPPPPRPTCARSFARSEWVQAAELCLEAAEGGSRDAQRMMGRMRELGNGVQQDPAQAANWYIKAAAAGDGESQRRLGYFYRSGTGVKKSEEESARWFRLGAEQGDPISMLEYGVALEGGDGVKKDEAAAAEWYRKAAAGGSGAALRRLGRMYERGRGVAKSEAEAVRYYGEAGEKGDAEAMYLLGRMFKDGRGVEKSGASALEWFKKAAALGHRDAAEEARKLERPD